MDGKTKDEEWLFRRGQEAMKRLHGDQTWTDWLTIGEALEGGRAWAMRAAHANQPVGRGYNEMFGSWLTQWGFDKIDKGDRARLFECMAHRVEIEEWRATLTMGERLRFNHPNTVLRHWQKRTVPKAKAPSPSPLAKMRDRVVAAEERAHAAEERAKRSGGGSNIDFDKDNIKDIGGAIARGLISPQKIRQLIRVLEGEARQREKSR